MACLPELRAAVSPFGPIEAVTIRRMLSHESGLPPGPPGTDWSVPVYQGAPELTLAQASDIVLTLPPNVQHMYSDLAYQLLGEIVSRAVVLVNGTSGSAELGCDLGSIARRLVLAAPPVIRAPEPMPGHYRPLLGLYARPQLGGWVLRLEWRDGNLVFTSPETAAWSLTLAPTNDPDVFLAEPGSDFAGEKVSFQRLADGRVASVLLMNSTFVRLERAAASG